MYLPLNVTTLAGHNKTLMQPAVASAGKPALVTGRLLHSCVLCRARYRLRKVLMRIPYSVDAHHRRMPGLQHPREVRCCAAFAMTPPHRPTYAPASWDTHTHSIRAQFAHVDHANALGTRHGTPSRNEANATPNSKGLNVLTTLRHRWSRVFGTHCTNTFSDWRETGGVPLY